MSKFDLKQFIRIKILKTKVTSKDFLENLRKRGAKIGRDVYIYSTSKTLIDSTCAHLLTIGDHVRIAEGVKILTHDYSWSVLKRYSSENIVPGKILGAQSATEIGNNVFIGMNAIITRGVTIGNNVVIGAGSVVTRNCPDDGVYAGNPASRIMSLEEFYRKREALQLEEAKDIAIRYKNRFQKQPPIEIFSEYFPLFLTRQEAEAIPTFRAQMGRMESFDETAAYMDAHKPEFDGYEAFLQYCYQQDQPQDDKESCL